MSPLATPPTTLSTALRAAFRRAGEWWLEPVEQRHVPWQHSGGWGDHSRTYARW